jgi:hypothetical protein
MTAKADGMKERKALSGSTSATTYFHQQSQVAEELGGRWSKADVVVGQKPSVVYPRLPSSSPWASDPVPPEEALVIDISAMEPVGTSTEIEASMAGEVGTASPPTASALAASPAPMAEAPVPPLPLSSGDAASRLAEVLPRLVRRRIR